MMHPYETLPPMAYWKLAVAQKSMFDIQDLWQPKFSPRPGEPIVTFGSCFAQHIGIALAGRSLNWFSAEPPPNGLSKENARKYNYNVFSARTGNIYTTSLLRQWTEWGCGRTGIPDEVWEKDGRIFDPFRPAIEPDGFLSVDEMRRSLLQTASSFGQCIVSARYFIFTLGLTESWMNRAQGYEYPMCPGTVAGRFDPQAHVFVNQDFDSVHDNLAAAIEMMRAVNPQLRFILTVSPVPLTATASNRHVLVATMASKSILRAVADQVAAERDYVDYFPSYEIINSPVFKGLFFEPNQRNVNPAGVNFVMDHFFTCMKWAFPGAIGQAAGGQAAAGAAIPAGGAAAPAAKTADEVCEEALLEAFAK